MEMLGSRPMNPRERQKRSRALRHIRKKEAAAAALRAYVRAGLVGQDEEALTEIAELLANLPDQLAQLRADVDELKEAGGPPAR